MGKNSNRRGGRASSHSENEVLIQPSAFRNTRGNEVSTYEDDIDDGPLTFLGSPAPIQSRPSRVVTTSPQRTLSNPRSPLRTRNDQENITQFDKSPRASPTRHLHLHRPTSPSCESPTFKPTIVQHNNLNLVAQARRDQLLNVPRIPVNPDRQMSMSAPPPGSPTRALSRNGDTPVTPPPLYPSPPQYNSPPLVNGERVRSFDLDTLPNTNANTRRDLELGRDDDVPLLTLAPEYGDDVGCISGLRRTGHILCLLFTLLLYGVIVLYFIGGAKMLHIPDHSFNVILFAVYSLYLIESMGCDTSSLLWQMQKAGDAQLHFHKMIDTAPWLKWTLSCYHYKPWINQDTAKPKDRVLTFTKTISFPLQGCTDETPMSFFTSHRLCKYTFKKEWRWQNDEARQRYEGVMAAFVEENSKDDHYVLDETWGIDGFRDGFLASRAGTGAPCWVSWSVYAVMMLLGFSFFYRMLLASKTGTQMVKFTKVLY
eukprot:m.50373 g.50373  ORF g.50373 m.50373 type:complete len:483 (-) comp21281_c1_seq1:149-1597(-)